MTLLAAVLSGFILAPAVSWLQLLTRRSTGRILALLPAGLFLYFALALLPHIQHGPLLFRQDWFPSLGIGLSFYVDGLSLLFALLITGIGALIFTYAGGYLAGHPHLGRMYAFLLMFMASMLGVAFAGNVLLMFVFWELTSLSSYLLIGFNHRDAESRAAALQALLVTGGGGLALMAGLLLLGQISGSLEFTDLIRQRDLIQAHPLYTAALVLILLGAFTKSAQFPFHFWLPGAMAAPTPVSAYLHSATMVKAGIYLLARLSPVLDGTETWAILVTAAGAATMAAGSFLALFQSDLKRLLAYSTVSALGILTLLLGLGSTLAIKGMVVFLLAHALYKGAMFMLAGIIDHETGTRDVDVVRGQRRLMPKTATVAFLAATSMAGLGFLAFVGKELALEAVLENEQSRLILGTLSVFAAAAFAYVAWNAGFRPFAGRESHTPRHAHDPGWDMLLGPGLLSVLGFLFGFVLGPLSHSLVEPAVSAIEGAHTAVHLHLIPTHISPPLVLSLLSLALGLGGGYWLAPRLRQARPRLEESSEYFGPAAGYRMLLQGMIATAEAQTQVLQNGKLRNYILVLVAFSVGMIGWSLFGYASVQIPPATRHDIQSYIIGALMIAGALVAVTTASRLTAVAAMGVVGFGVALIFIFYGAPDLAMTQFSIETLTVILFVLVLYRLPHFRSLSAPSTRLRDAIIALASGGLMTLLVLTVTSDPAPSRLAPFFAEYSYALAHGRNVVNVILVDFRGFDTMGEISVLGIASVGVYALLKLRPRSEETAPNEATPETSALSAPAEVSPTEKGA